MEWTKLVQAWLVSAEKGCKKKKKSKEKEKESIAWKIGGQFYQTKIRQI